MLGRRVESKPPPDDPSLGATSATGTTATGTHSGSAHTAVGGAVAAAVPDERSWSGAGSYAHSHAAAASHPDGGHHTHHAHNPLLDSAGAAAAGLPSVVRLSDGSSLAADVVLWCTGSRPAAAFMAGGELAGCLDERGAVKVGTRACVVMCVYK